MTLLRRSISAASKTRSRSLARKARPVAAILSGAAATFFGLGAAQAATITDDFARADSTTVGNGWTEVETTATGAQIVGGVLKLGSTTAGEEYVYQAPTPVYSILSQETNLIEWDFNMRQTRPDPSGLQSGGYGVAFVLGSTATTNTSGTGYAIILGQSLSVDGLRLAKFSAGLAGSTGLTDIISANDYGAEYLSVKVTYNPAGNLWSLFAVSSATAFVDPTTVTTQLGTTVADSTYTGVTLNSFGSLWNHGTSPTDNAIFDNITLKDGAPIGGGGGGNSLFWIGSNAVLGGPGIWDQATTSSWSASDTTIAPTVFDSTKKASFGGAETPKTVTVSGTVNLAAGIDFTTADYVLSGGTLNLAGAAATNNSISVSTGTAIIDSALTGSTGWSVSGGGILILTGASTVTGDTNVGGGATLQVGNGATAGSLAGNVIDGGTLAFNLSSNLAFAGIVSGAGAVVQMGTGSLELTGVNTYTGLTTISNGVLRVSNASALGGTTAGTVVASGAALELNAVTIGAEALTLNGTGPNGAGALRTTAGTSVYGGNVTLATSSNITAIAGSSLTMTGSIFGSANATLTTDGAGDIGFSGVISGATTSLSLVGTGTTTLSGVNTFGTGTSVVINSGTLAVSGGSALPDTTGILIGPGATFKLNASERIGSLNDSGGGSIINLQGNALTIGDATDSTIASVISGNGGSLVKQGIGTLNLAAANTYTGGTSIVTGAVKIQAGGSISGTITSQASLLADAGVTIPNNIVANGTPTQRLLSGYDFQTTTTGGTVASATAAPLVYNANFGTGAFYLDGTHGSSTFTSSMLSSFSGTTVNGGTGFATATVAPASLAILGSANNLSGVFVFDITGGSNLAISYATQTSSTAGFTGQAFSYSTDGVTFQALQTISTIPLTFGQQVLATTAALNGATTVYIKLTLTGATTSTSNNRFDNVQFNVDGPTLSNTTLGTDATTGTALFTGNVTLNAGANLTAAAGGTASFSGVFADGANGAQGINKIGAGIAVLTGNNTFTGTATVTAGRLSLAGDATHFTLGGATAVNLAGGTLSLAASNQINNSAAIILNAGVVDATGTPSFSLNGFSEVGSGFTAGVGGLKFQKSSILDFGTGASSIEFNAATTVYTDGLLFVTNWDLGVDHLLFDGPIGQDVIAHIVFSNFNGIPGVVRYNGQYEVIPEPSMTYVAVGLLGLFRFRNRRQKAA